MWEWVQQNIWTLWLVAAGGLAVSEMLTLDMTLLMLAGGALAGAGVSSPCLLRYMTDALERPLVILAPCAVSAAGTRRLAGRGKGKAEPHLFLETI